MADENPDGRPKFTYQSNPADSLTFAYFPPGPEPEFVYNDNRPGGKKLVAVKAAADIITSELAKLSQIHDATVSKPATRNMLDPTLYREILFGPPRNSDRAYTFRGYLMIEPEDIYEAMSRLFHLGRSRAKAGQTLDFRWLLPDDNYDANFLRQRLHIPYQGDKLNGVYITDGNYALVTVLADSLGDMEGILRITNTIIMARH